MSIAKNWAEGIESASKTSRLPPFEIGTHVCRIDEAKAFEAFKGKKPTVTVNFTVEQSDTIRVGAKRGWVTQEGDYPQYFLADIKNLIAAAFNSSESEVDSAATVAYFDAKGYKQSGKILVTVSENTKNPKFPHIRFDPVTE